MCGSACRCVGAASLPSAETLGDRTGAIHQCYGDDSYAAVEVQFGDGRSELFWHHELKEVKSSNSDPGESRDSLWGGRRVKGRWCEEPSLTTSHMPLRAPTRKRRDRRRRRGCIGDCRSPVRVTMINIE
jgi:hypothetical protein